MWFVRFRMNGIISHKKRRHEREREEGEGVWGRLRGKDGGGLTRYSRILTRAFCHRLFSLFLPLFHPLCFSFPHLTHSTHMIVNTFFTWLHVNTNVDIRSCRRTITASHTYWNMNVIALPHTHGWSQSHSCQWRLLFLLFRLQTKHSCVHRGERDGWREEEEGRMGGSRKHSELLLYGTENVSSQFLDWVRWGRAEQQPYCHGDGIHPTGEVGLKKYLIAGCSCLSTSRESGERRVERVKFSMPSLQLWSPKTKGCAHPCIITTLRCNSRWLVI